VLLSLVFFGTSLQPAQRRRRSFHSSSSPQTLPRLWWVLCEVGPCRGSGTPGSAAGCCSECLLLKTVFESRRRIAGKAQSNQRRRRSRVDRDSAASVGRTSANFACSAGRTSVGVRGIIAAILCAVLWDEVLLAVLPKDDTSFSDCHNPARGKASHPHEMAAAHQRAGKT